MAPDLDRTSRQDHTDQLRADQHADKGLFDHRDKVGWIAPDHGEWPVAAGPDEPGAHHR